MFAALSAEGYALIIGALGTQILAILAFLRSGQRKHEENKVELKAQTVTAADSNDQLRELVGLMKAHLANGHGGKKE